MTTYLTTAIPYVNGAPHLGHALEFVQADVLARHRRSRGEATRFLTGTDDNALKNVTAADAAGVDVREFVDANAARFAGLREPLRLSNDDFIRTTEQRHIDGVRELWRRSDARGDFYRRDYTGRYCAGCEQFYLAGELVDGRCPEHGTVPEEIVEQNWFFRLSRYQDEILDALESGRVRIEPTVRRNEVLAFVRSGLQDLSVSRPAARAGGWGIAVPGDPDQVVYVWWDALANYVTALASPESYEQWWDGADERIHLIGKGIVRFHAVYWLGLLLSAGLPLPTAILVHGYLGVDGQKIAKSGVQSVDPRDLLEAYGSDALRWWFVRDVGPVEDTDFTVERLIERHDRDLAGGIGNLVQRTLTLVQRAGGHVAAAGPHALRDTADALPGLVDDALHRFDLRAATGAVLDVVGAANRYVESEQPWRLSGTDRDRVLAQLVLACRVIAHELAPFLPDAAARLQAQLGAGEHVGVPVPAFLRIGSSSHP